MSKKKRSRKKDKIPDFSGHLDDQLEGAVMEAVQKIKPYCDKGVMIIHSPNDRWKVVTFGHGDAKSEFDGVLSGALNIGARALIEGPDGATSWEA